jgi:2-polyprenyl-3-methyl-5-hydroxy-6-metoxy-1,4-benzoquinol methylase
MGALLFDDGAEESASAEVRGLLKLTGLKRGSVLDTACGYGRHSRALAQRGFQVTGVDLMPGYLAEARRRAKAAGVAVTFKKADLRDLRAYRGGFDLVLNLYTSFGYEAGKPANAAVFKQLVAALKPGGWLALELVPRESLEAVTEPYEERPLADGVLVEQREWLSGGRLATRVHWARGRKVTVRDSVLQTYTRKELLALAKAAGLAKIQGFGSYAGRPFKVGGRFLLAGRKA